MCKMPHRWGWGWVWRGRGPSEALKQLGKLVFCFFFTVLGFELRAYTLSNSTSPFL
jgi:hypothetical protein